MVHAVACLFAIVRIDRINFAGFHIEYPDSISVNDSGSSVKCRNIWTPVERSYRLVSHYVSCKFVAEISPF